MLSNALERSNNTKAVTSTEDAVMTRLCFQSLCHAFRYVAALMI